LVLWIPLVVMAEDMGSGVICEASNRQGCISQKPLEGYAFKSSFYQTGIPDEELVIADISRFSRLASQVICS